MQTHLTEKSKKMTLLDYYNSLKVKQKSPKTLFIERIAKKCKVTEGAVRYWIYKKEKPRKEEHIRILEQETGITREYLFNN